jgi:acetyl esterase/lipase
MNKSVIICPGGGYRFVSPREAEPVADRFKEKGWEPFILRYSVGERLGAGPLKEAAALLQQVRSERGGFVALCGFSAGAHLAASLGVHWNNTRLFPDTADRHTLRPDALVLAYPVISGGKYAHRESFDRLTLGTEYEGEDFFSLEEYAGAETPPSFLWHTVTDEAVPVQNSILFAEALIAANVPVELHLYPQGPHGLSLATEDVAEYQSGKPPRAPDAHVAGWFNLCIEWLENLAGA